MPRSLPRTDAQCRNVIWREILHHGSGDDIYESNLLAIVKNDKAGICGGIVGAINAAVAATGIIFALDMFAFAYTMLFSAEDSPFIEQVLVRPVIIFAIIALLSCAFFGFAIGFQTKLPVFFNNMFIGFVILIVAPFVASMNFLMPLVLGSFASFLLSIAKAIFFADSTLQPDVLLPYFFAVTLIISLAFLGVLGNAIYSSFVDPDFPNGPEWKGNARSYSWAWRKPATYPELERAIRTLGDKQLKEAVDEIAKTNLDAINPEIVANNMQSDDYVRRFIARQQCVQVGGEMVPLLNRVSADLALLLITQISTSTTKKLSKGRHLCPECCSVVQQRTASFSGHAFKYWGCRICHNSRQIAKFKGALIGTIDPTSSVTLATDSINYFWNYSRTEFIGDLDRFEVCGGSDEDVERFLIDLSDEQDEERLRMYRKAPLILKISGVSDNTIRMGKEFFKRVKRETT